MAPGRSVEKLDTMPSHDPEVAHLAAGKASCPRICLLCIASRDNAIIHHHQHTFAARSVRGSNSNRGKQVNGAIWADSCRRPLSANDDDRLLGLYGEMKEKCRFLEAVCPVRHDDSGNLRTLLKNRIDISGKLQPLIRCDVGARNICKLRRLDLRVSSDLWYSGHDFANRFANIVASKRPRLTLLAGNRPAGSDNQHSRRFHRGLGADSTQNGTQNEDETEEHHGNRESFQHCSR